MQDTENSPLRQRDPSMYHSEAHTSSAPHLTTNGLRPMQVLRTTKFYIFWMAMFLNCSISYYLSSMYKVWLLGLFSFIPCTVVIHMWYIFEYYPQAYGQTFIADDHFLALVGSVASGFNCAGRLVWGKLLDRFHYKVFFGHTFRTLLVIF